MIFQRFLLPGNLKLPFLAAFFSSLSFCPCFLFGDRSKVEEPDSTGNCLSQSIFDCAYRVICVYERLFIKVGCSLAKFLYTTPRRGCVSPIIMNNLCYCNFFALFFALGGAKSC